MSEPGLRLACFWVDGQGSLSQVIRSDGAALHERLARRKSRRGDASGNGSAFAPKLLHQAARDTGASLPDQLPGRLVDLVENHALSAAVTGSSLADSVEHPWQVGRGGRDDAKHLTLGGFSLMN